MVSRENRVSLVSLGLVALLGIVVAVTDIGAESPITAFLLVAVVGVLLPQLYLARTGDEVGPAARVRVGGYLTALFAFAFANNAPAFERRVLATVGIGLLVALLVREAVAGYREAAPE
jgi:hypothetical protein